MISDLSDISIVLENNKTKITTTGNYTFHWNVSGNSIDADYDKTNFKTRLGWYLGYREPSYVVSGQSGAVVSESIININTTSYVFLVVDEYSQNHPNSFVSPLSDSYMNKNILARMPVDNGYVFGNMISGTQQNNLLSDIRKYGSKTTIYKLKIQLVDEWGVPLDLNKLDFSFVLEVEYE